MKTSFIYSFAMSLFIALLMSCGSSTDPTPAPTPQRLVKTISRNMALSSTVQSASLFDYTYTNCLLTKQTYTETVTGSTAYTTNYQHLYTYDTDGYVTRYDYTYSYASSGGANNSTAYGTYEYEPIGTAKRLKKSIAGGSQIGITTTTYDYDANGKVSQIVASQPAINANSRPLLYVTTSTYTNGLLTGFSANSDGIVTQPYTIQNGLVTRRNTSTPNYYTTATYDANGRETVFESWTNGGRTTRTETAYAASGIDLSIPTFKGHPNLSAITGGVSALPTQRTLFRTNGFRNQDFLYIYTIDNQQFVTSVANTTNTYANNVISDTNTGLTNYTYIDCL